MHIPPHKAIIKAFPRNCKSRGGKFTKENVSVFQQLPAGSGNFSKMSIFFLFSVPTHQNSRRKADALRRLFFVTEPSGRAGEGLTAPYPFGESVWFPGKLLQWAHLIVHSRPSGLEQAAPSGSPERPAPTLGWRRNSPPSLIRTAAAYCCRLNRRPSPGGILGRRRSPPSVLPGCPPGKGACRIPLCPPVDLRRNRRFPPPRHRYVGHPDLPGRRQRPRVAGSGFPHIV